MTQVKLSKEVKREAKAAAKAAKKEAKKAAKNMEAEMTAARHGVALDRSDHSLILRCNPTDTLLQLSRRRNNKGPRRSSATSKQCHPHLTPARQEHIAHSTLLSRDVCYHRMQCLQDIVMR